MEDSFVINLHFNNKVIQKKVSNDFNLFKHEIFKFTSKNASNYIIEYYEIIWNILDENKFKRFSKLFKKEVRIRIDTSKKNQLIELLVVTITRALEHLIFKRFKNYYKLIKEYRLKIKNELINKISNKKMNEYFNFVSRDNEYQSNIIENNFNLYYSLNDLTPTFKRLHINFNDMNLEINDLEE